MSDANEADRLIPQTTVSERTGLGRTSLYLKSKAGEFPQPVKIGARRIAWREADVSAWIASRPAAYGAARRRPVPTFEERRMPFVLGARSRAKLQGVHPDLVRVAERAIKITPQDFAVLEGVRTPERQRELYAQGRTKPGPKVTWTLNSNHFKRPDGYGHAIDVGAWVDGKVDFGTGRYIPIIRAFMEAARELGVNVRSGADWDQDGRFMEKGETDLGHFEVKP